MRCEELATVINCVAAGPIMTMKLASSQKVMGDFRVGRRQQIFGWAATVVMVASSIAMFALWGR